MIWEVRRKWTAKELLSTTLYLSLKHTPSLYLWISLCRYFLFFVASHYLPLSWSLSPSICLSVCFLTLSSSHFPSLRLALPLPLLSFSSHSLYLSLTLSLSISFSLVVSIYLCISIFSPRSLTRSLCLPLAQALSLLSNLHFHWVLHSSSVNEGHIQPLAPLLALLLYVSLSGESRAVFRELIHVRITTKRLYLFFRNYHTKRRWLWNFLVHPLSWLWNFHVHHSVVSNIFDLNISFSTPIYLFLSPQNLASEFLSLWPSFSLLLGGSLYLNFPHLFSLVIYRSCSRSTRLLISTYSILGSKIF